MFDKLNLWYDWIFLGSALAAFLLGTFVLPGYESHLRRYGGMTHDFQVSNWAISLTYFFLFCEGLLWVVRLLIYKWVDD